MKNHTLRICNRHKLFVYLACKYHLHNVNSFIVGNTPVSYTHLKCVEMELGEPDESGRRRPVVKPDSEFVLDVDAVVISIDVYKRQALQHSYHSFYEPDYD